MRLLKEHLDQNAITNKHRIKDDGTIIKGKSFSRGCLYNILTNPIYIGQIRHKDIIHQGQHESIIDKQLWDKVHLHIADNRIGQKTNLRKTEHCPLAGKLFDASSGERLVPVHANKKGKRYRYYVSKGLTSAPATASNNSWRLPGKEIEQITQQLALQLLHNRNTIIDALQKAGVENHYIPSILQATQQTTDANKIIDKYIKSVELNQNNIRLSI